MTSFRSAAPAPVLGSLFLHALVLIAFGLWTLTEQRQDFEIPIESILTEDREQPDFQRDLEESSTAADTLNFQSGGLVSTVNNPTAAANTTSNLQAKVEESPLAKKPRLDVRVNPLSPPRTEAIASGIADQSVQGETGALVEGYGEAMSKLTQELVNVMREQRVLVVWMLDESESMRDDRDEISGKIDKVFEELGVATQADRRLRRGKDVLVQAVVTYGRNWTERLSPPSPDLEKVKEAIKVGDESQIDRTGDENMCAAIKFACEKYGKMATVQDRKCIVILVSDESGDDGQLVEEALEAARNVKDTARLYVLGRESVFGQRTAYMSVKDPDPQYKGANRWLPIRRGPETAHVEGLQWNGLGGSREHLRSYFGPYEMCRLAKETGGIFFVLPGEEEKLVGEIDRSKRKYDFLDMLEYSPRLESRPDYEAAVKGSPFRTGIFRVILALDPDHPNNPLLPNNPPKPENVLQVYDGWYPIEAQALRAKAADDVKRAIYAMNTLDRAIEHLEELEHLRAAEESTRWRANFDLIHAQCVNYKVRLFQSLLAMDEHVNNMPKLKDEKSNRWRFDRSGRVIRPDETQYERLKTSFGLEVDRETFVARLDKWIEFARKRYQTVIEEHAGTPWARRAEAELQWGFGMGFSEHYDDPSDDETPNKPRKVALPKL